MFRKLALAAALAFGMGGAAMTVQSVQAAVVHPTANAGVIQAIEQSAPAPDAAQKVYHRGRPHYGRPHYGRPHWRPRPHRYCRVKRVRVHTYYGWRWVNRRVCWR
ncbi:hypothetical protein ACN6KF_000582 [Labrys sp. La1]|uniref:hypothetical protein n=1 Tax=Labrys sp. La1 TaxID=3404917 RepID=UPI003EB7F9C0